MGSRHNRAERTRSSGWPTPIRMADGLGSRVGALILSDARDQAEQLIQHRADHVCLMPDANIGQNAAVAAAELRLSTNPPQVIFAGGDAVGRELACRLAARTGWRLISPGAGTADRKPRTEHQETSHYGHRLDRQTGAASTQGAGNDHDRVTLRSGVADSLPPPKCARTRKSRSCRRRSSRSGSDSA